MTNIPGSTEAPAGINPDAIARWLGDRVEIAGPLTYSVIAGGHSNLTFVVADRTGRRWVLRRPPLGQVLATAHDMGREARIVSALADSDVPVPSIVDVCHDTEVNGAPFYVMDFVDGLVVRDAAAAAGLDAAARAQASRSIAEVLAALHRVDVEEVGLGDLAKRTGYIERQLDRWNRQAEASTTQSGVELPAIGDIYRRLRSSVPPCEEVCLVHGDYRLDNAILSPDGSIAAVLDWELCTLGDPMADVGLLAVYWADPGEAAALPQTGPTALDGFWRSREVIAHYAEVSGRDTSAIDFYVAFGYWKLTCIIAGVYARYAGGAMGTVGDAQVDGFRTMLDRLAELALAACTSDRSAR